MPGDWTDGNFWSYTSGGFPAMATSLTTDNVYIENDMNLDADYVFFGYTGIEKFREFNIIVLNKRTLMEHQN